MARTIFEKLWDRHLVADLGEGTGLVLIDRVLLHERTGGIAVESPAAAGREPACGRACLMEAFTTLRSRAAPLIRDNVDMDAIVPSREMKPVSRTGLAGGLCAGWRDTQVGGREPRARR